MKYIQKMNNKYFVNGKTVSKMDIVNEIVKTDKIKVHTDLYNFEIKMTKVKQYKSDFAEVALNNLNKVDNYLVIN